MLLFQFDSTKFIDDITTHSGNDSANNTLHYHLLFYIKKKNKQSTFENNEKTKQKNYNLIVFRYIETKYGVIHSRSEVNQITKHEVNTQKDEKLNLI
ncbi:hypothetical protein BLOT_003606 [Blomia tropicalis]|nr:hypothetical protein BLOT_003606 [Blomia tropicalis]